MAWRRKFGRRIVHGLVEVAAVVGRHGHRPVVRAGLQQEELDLGVHVAGEAQVAGLGQLAAQHVRESAHDGEPSGMVMSQNMRAE